ncbi:hypothetical protein AK812_SmicGene7463 [Symbiodinium microadriaticum]|uniref:Uncharacterized protein n=1 Tax=Symbiodinium microadriaticum TaxID=2951 RepID=A0A1Q9ENJ3_SYMMI|nr:hypothetical protein AK812_SmicGene7463 [Symbiodinium microadriaticum]
MHDRVSIRDEVPRLKQLTMQEAMDLAQEVEMVHEVIEIVALQRLCRVEAACAEHCAFLAFQTVGAALALYAYLRTYVARAVLCPKRAQLLVTGCSFFGQPRAEDEAIQLSQIRPGYSLEGGYIKFRMEGPAWDASRWVWFRIPRSEESGNTAKGAQVGFRPERPSPKESTASQTVVPERTTQPSQRRFMGAGLGGANAGDEEARGSAPRPPTVKQVVVEQTSDTAPAKVLALKLENGLPATARDEQLLLDFFEDPNAYGVTMR